MLSNKQFIKLFAEKNNMDQFTAQLISSENYNDYKKMYTEMLENQTERPTEAVKRNITKEIIKNDEIFDTSPEDIKRAEQESKDIHKRSNNTRRKKKDDSDDQQFYQPPPMHQYYQPMPQYYQPMPPAFYQPPQQKLSIDEEPPAKKEPTKKRATGRTVKNAPKKKPTKKVLPKTLKYESDEEVQSEDDE